MRGQIIPNFHNLSHLQASFSSSSLHYLLVFLESCPTLKNLILVRICFDILYMMKYIVTSIRFVRRRFVFRRQSQEELVLPTCLSV